MCKGHSHQRCCSAVCRRCTIDVELWLPWRLVRDHSLCVPAGLYTCAHRHTQWHTEYYLYWSQGVISGCGFCLASPPEHSPHPTPGHSDKFRTNNIYTGLSTAQHYYIDRGASSTTYIRRPVYSNSSEDIYIGMWGCPDCVSHAMLC